ncbi:MAG: hypothetical protein HN336_04375 [Lentimicrobiaceae bacterium]|nr:hypothetical protein [Lentimicrobiaceae bacterium]MCP4910030.1 hypothetical protein [Bacteroidota bacterium]MBT3454185.1 hypothetical protein [Lentimicrobiaceae bacterium]MBT3819210.1 hypothetical protein [Lentimicrobiaceae bacterium]MBT4060345.1 hypothetical protein [Lentimicrobiaceae bacterium]
MTEKKLIVLLLSFTLLFICDTVYGQRNQSKCDTVQITSPAFLVLNDTTIHVLTDSLAIVCQRYVVITKKNGYALYNKLQSFSSKNNLINELFQMIIASSNQDTMLINKAIINAEDPYVPYTGKIIRNIKIQVLKPFGPSISDTNLPVVSIWARTLNESHIDTRNITIERKLLFKANDTINPYELVENTNELAGLPYLQDAAIILSDASKDSVDVVVLVKDKFPWLPDIDIRSATDMTLYLTNVNIFGLGQSLKGGVTMNTKSSPFIYMSDVRYFNSNLYNQITLEANYHIADYDKQYQVKMSRDIIPLSVRLGGGAEINRQEENIVIDPTDIDQSRWYFKYWNYELYATYLLYDKWNKNKSANKHTFFIPGIAASKKEYIYRPYISADSNSRFSDYTQILGNFAVVQQNYYRTNFLKSFGKAEYIPYGLQAIVTAGYTWSEFMNKPYIGLSLIGSRNFKNIGFFLLDAQFGAHISNSLDQGVLNMNLAYLTNIYKKERYRFRYLGKLSYTTGINRFTNDMLYLGEDYGFVGIKDKAFYGQERLFAEFNVISYTPWYIFGFRFAVFGFVSSGMLAMKSTPVFKGDLITSVGLGVYTQNDFLAFDSFQVRVAYFPVTPGGVSSFGISLSSIGFLNQANFLNTKPSTVEYR